MPDSTLTSNIRRHPSSSMSKAGSALNTPTLLIRMSTPGTRADIRRDAARAELGRDRVHPCRIQSVHDHFGSPAPQHPCDRLTDTGGRAGDERDAPCQVDLHVALPFEEPSPSERASSPFNNRTANREAGDRMRDSPLSRGASYGVH